MPILTLPFTYQYADLKKNPLIRSHPTETKVSVLLESAKRTLITDPSLIGTHFDSPLDKCLNLLATNQTLEEHTFKQA